jgi:formiminotetrahydrofolate cyclodeaminase
VGNEAGRGSPDIGNLSVGAFISELGSAQPAPGCGAAAAVALSLAAACAAKAAAISLTHEPNDVVLREGLKEISKLARDALAGAEKDARAFEKVLKEDTAQASRELLKADWDLLAQCRSLEAWVDRIQPRVRPNVAGDLSAARELLRAAAHIHHLNLGEAEGAVTTHRAL